MTTLKKNFIYQIMYQILNVLLPIVTAPYVSRVLGVRGIGVYSYLYAITTYFSLFGMLGIANHGSRSIALIKHKPQEIKTTFCNIYAIQVFSVVLVICAYIGYMQFFLLQNRIIGIINILFLFSCLIDISWFFFGMEAFALTVIRNMILKGITVASVFLFVKESGDLWKYALIVGTGTCISQAYLWIYMKPYLDLSGISWKEIRQHVRPVFILFIPILAYSIYRIMDKIMLGYIADIDQVGLYSNAEKMISIPQSLITSFGTVMLPRISFLVAGKNQDQMEIYARNSFLYLSIAASAMVFGMIGVSNNLAPVFFGIAFQESAPLISGLSITLLFITWSSIIRTQFLIPQNKNNPYLLSTVIGALINLTVNLLLIPKFQAMGALAGTVLAEFMVFFIQAICVRNEFPVMRYLKTALPCILAGILMCFCVRWLGGRMELGLVTLLIQIGLGAALYCSMILCLYKNLLWKRRMH